MAADDTLPRCSFRAILAPTFGQSSALPRSHPMMTMTTAAGSTLYEQQRLVRIEQTNVACPLGRPSPRAVIFKLSIFNWISIDLYHQPHRLLRPLFRPLRRVKHHAQSIPPSAPDKNKKSLYQLFPGAADRICVHILKTRIRAARPTLDQKLHKAASTMMSGDWHRKSAYPTYACAGGVRLPFRRTLAAPLTHLAEPYCCRTGYSWNAWLRQEQIQI